MVPGLLRKAANLLGMGGSWRDPQISDVVMLSGAAKMLDRHRNVVLYWAKTGKIMSIRPWEPDEDRNSGNEWLFGREHILEVADLLRQTNGRIDEVATILRERESRRLARLEKRKPGPE